MCFNFLQAVSGRYISQSFDMATGLFQLTFNVLTDVKSTTDIYLNEKIHYPNGYSVRCVYICLSVSSIIVIRVVYQWSSNGV